MIKFVTRTAAFFLAALCLQTPFAAHALSPLVPGGATLTFGAVAAKCMSLYRAKNAAEKAFLANPNEETAAAHVTAQQTFVRWRNVLIGAFGGTAAAWFFYLKGKEEGQTLPLPAPTAPPSALLLAPKTPSPNSPAATSPRSDIPPFSAPEPTAPPATVIVDTPPVTEEWHQQNPLPSTPVKKPESPLPAAASNRTSPTAPALPTLVLAEEPQSAPVTPQRVVSPQPIVTASVTSMPPITVTKQKSRTPSPARTEDQKSPVATPSQILLSATPIIAVHAGPQISPSHAADAVPTTDTPASSQVTPTVTEEDASATDFATLVEGIKSGKTNTELVQYLNKTTTAMTDADGYTPLALLLSQKTIDPYLVESLVRKGAPLDTAIRFPDGAVTPPLIYALTHGWYGYTLTALITPASTQAKDSAGRLPLTICFTPGRIKADDLAIFGRILNAMPDPNIVRHETLGEARTLLIVAITEPQYRPFLTPLLGCKKIKLSRKENDNVSPFLASLNYGCKISEVKALFCNEDEPYYQDYANVWATAFSPRMQLPNLEECLNFLMDKSILPHSSIIRKFEKKEIKPQTLTRMKAAASHETWKRIEQIIKDGRVRNGAGEGLDDLLGELQSLKKADLPIDTAQAEKAINDFLLAHPSTIVRAEHVRTAQECALSTATIEKLTNLDRATKKARAQEQLASDTFSRAYEFSQALPLLADTDDEAVGLVEQFLASRPDWAQGINHTDPAAFPKTGTLIATIRERHKVANEQVKDAKRVAELLALRADLSDAEIAAALHQAIHHHGDTPTEEELELLQTERYKRTAPGNQYGMRSRHLSSVWETVESALQAQQKLRAAQAAADEIVAKATTIAAALDVYSTTKDSTETARVERICQLADEGVLPATSDPIDSDIKLIKWHAKGALEYVKEKIAERNAAFQADIDRQIAESHEKNKAGLRHDMAAATNIKKLLAAVKARKGVLEDLKTEINARLAELIAEYDTPGHQLPRIKSDDAELAETLALDKNLIKKMKRIRKKMLKAGNGRKDDELEADENAAPGAAAASDARDDDNE